MCNNEYMDKLSSYLKLIDLYPAGRRKEIFYRNSSLGNGGIWVELWSAERFGPAVRLSSSIHNFYLVTATKIIK